MFALTNTIFMKELTKAEEEIMLLLWELKNACVKDLLDKFDEPKPAYNTISTIVRILETKGFIGHNAIGKTYKYFPTVSRDEYRKLYLGNMVQNYFGNSYRQLVSFFSDHNDVDISDLEEIKKMIDKKLSETKK
jgi:BlaI family transcriptional regulator, penicillinase repressor